MKRITLVISSLVLILALVLSLGLTACSSTEKTAATTAAPAITTTATPAPTTSAAPAPKTTTPPPPAKPAAFTLSNLSIVPAEIDLGGQVTVTVLVKNTGESKGSYEVNYKVNNEFLQYKTVTIDGGTQQTLTVTIIGKKAGTNTLNVNDLSDTFTVKAPPPSTDTTTPAVIPWQEAKNHIGETITVEGPIIDKFDIGTAMLLGMGKSATDSGTVGIEISYSLASELPADLFVGLTIKATGLTYINPLGGCSLKVNAASDIEVVE